MDSSFYTSCSILVLGCHLYQDNLGTTPVINGYYSDYTGCFAVSGGVITSVNSCTSGVTSYQYLVNASATNGFATQSPACTGNTIYPIWSSVSNISSITSGTTLYGDVNLTSPWVGQTEWYGLGTSYGGSPLSGYQITNSGIVSLIDTCPCCGDISLVASNYTGVDTYYTYNDCVTNNLIFVTVPYGSPDIIVNGRIPCNIHAFSFTQARGTALESCGDTTQVYTLYSPTTVLTTGSSIYEDSSCYYPFAHGTVYLKELTSGKVWGVNNSGVLISSTTC